MNKFLLLTCSLMLMMWSCEPKTSNENKAEQKSAHEWAKNSSIYEVNIRQYTPEGNFEAFLAHMEEIRDLGSDILWFMPIHPIGEKNRKGGLGSYYSIKDYKAVNPNFGTKDDFKQLVDSAHAMGFKVILDWVANHTAWDHHWVKDHPGFYTADSNGNRPVVPEGTDWTDVADLNYENKELQTAMIDAMQYWVREFDIDGYRCDVAGFVPMEFWKKAVDSLQKIKPVFMLAEWDEPKMHKAFHMTYAWGFHHILKQIAEGGDPKKLVYAYYEDEQNRYPDSAYRMYFITNHDENSWKNSVFERYGEDVELLAILTFTLDGMPLVYSGQEVGMDQSLKFFDKDTIEWKNSMWRTFYSQLLDLHENVPALWNGAYGAKAKWVKSPNGVLAYKRLLDDQGIYVYLNFSNRKVELPVEDLDMRVYMSSDESGIAKDTLTLPPKGYYIGETEKRNDF